MTSLRDEGLHLAFRCHGEFRLIRFFWGTNDELTRSQRPSHPQISLPPSKASKCVHTPTGLIANKADGCTYIIIPWVGGGETVDTLFEHSGPLMLLPSWTQIEAVAAPVFWVASLNNLFIFIRIYCQLRRRRQGHVKIRPGENLQDRSLKRMQDSIMSRFELPSNRKCPKATLPIIRPLRMPSLNQCLSWEWFPKSPTSRTASLTILASWRPRPKRRRVLPNSNAPSAIKRRKDTCIIAYSKCILKRTTRLHREGRKRPGSLEAPWLGENKKHTFRTDLSKRKWNGKNTMKKYKQSKYGVKRPSK